MTESEIQNTQSKLIAGEVCLDFANTLHWHASDAPQETLKSYADLVAWCRSADLLDAAESKRLLREAQGNPTTAKRALKRAVTLRELIYRLALSIARRERAAPKDIEEFDRAVGSALQHLRIVPSGSGFVWGWESDEHALDSMFWRILRSAADLFTSERRTRIGQCADDRGCGWLFLDTTKNRSRRWCQMGDCGNRAKAQRHRKRSRARASRGKR